MDVDSTVGLAVGLFLFLFIAYIYLESREINTRGKKYFSPQKLGKVLKKTFSLCLPDCVLLAVANFFIFCGFVGNSCMEHIHSDEDKRQSRKMARLAATLSRNKGKGSKKKSKHRKSNAVDDEAEESLFSCDNESNSDVSDLENGSIDSGRRRKRETKSKRRHHRSDELEKSDGKMALPAIDHSSDSAHNYGGLIHAPPTVPNSNSHQIPSEEKTSKSDSRLNLSQHSTKASPGAVSRESLQALIQAEDNALGYRQAKV